MVTELLFHATMAQSVERLTRNEKVAGSIPAGSLHQKSPQNLGVLPVNRTIKNNKFLYRQPNYGWRYFYATFVY